MLMCDKVTDKEIQDLAKGSSKLESLSLIECGNVTNIGLKKLPSVVVCNSHWTYVSHDICIGHIVVCNSQSVMIHALYT